MTITGVIQDKDEAMPGTTLDFFNYTIGALDGPRGLAKIRIEPVEPDPTKTSIDIDLDATDLKELIVALKAALKMIT